MVHRGYIRCSGIEGLDVGALGLGLRAWGLLNALCPDLKPRGVGFSMVSTSTIEFCA